MRPSRAEQRRLALGRRLVAGGVSSRRTTKTRRKALEGLVAYTSGLPDAGCPGLPDAGCRCSVFPTRAGRDHGVLTERAVMRFRFSRALAGTTHAGRDRVRLLDSDLAIIPYSVRAESMTSSFTSELRSATLPPRAVSIRMAIVETAAGRIRAGSVPNCTPGTD